MKGITQASSRQGEDNKGLGFGLPIADGEWRRSAEGGNSPHDKGLPEGVHYGVCREDTRSSHHYSPEHKPLNISAQKEALRKAFPGLNAKDVRVDYGPLLPGAEEQYAFPRWQAIASSYEGAMKELLVALHHDRGGLFYSYLTEYYGNNWLRLLPATVEFHERLAEEQSGNGILVVSAQLGLRHIGRPAVLPHGTLGSNEFYLDPFTFGAILLAHPVRFMRASDPWVACPGAQVNDPDSRAYFSRIAIFGYAGAQLLFGSRESTEVVPNCGAATAFLS